MNSFFSTILCEIRDYLRGNFKFPYYELPPTQASRDMYEYLLKKVDILTEIASYGTVSEVNTAKLFLRVFADVTPYGD